MAAASVVRGKNYFVGQVIYRGVGRPDTVKVRLTKMRLDPHIHKYFNKRINRWSVDFTPSTTIGDIVLIETLPAPVYPRVSYKIHSVLYKVGGTVDPITGRRCRGKEFIDMEQRQNFNNIIQQTR